MATKNIKQKVVTDKRVKELEDDLKKTCDLLSKLMKKLNFKEEDF